jgi:hypothetical protein
MVKSGNFLNGMVIIAFLCVQRNTQEEYKLVVPSSGLSYVGLLTIATMVSFIIICSGNK